MGNGYDFCHLDGKVYAYILSPCQGDIHFPNYFKVILQVSFVVLIVVNIYVETRKLRERLSNLLWLLLLSPTQLGMSVFLTTTLYLYAFSIASVNRPL